MPIQDYFDVTDKQAEKLETAAELEGYASAYDMIEESLMDGLCPSICMNCDHIENWEPDAQDGLCPECQTPTMMSVLVIAGII